MLAVPSSSSGIMRARLAFGAVRRRILAALAFATGVVLALAGGASSALAQTDVIRGRVTNSEGLPLGNVRVTATSIPGGVTRESRK